MSALKEVTMEYVYITIPIEYICVYHQIMSMLADYGEDMLKDCKASCTERNSGVIECFNMFNAAISARKLGKTKLAETLIKYIKAKIKQINRNKGNCKNFVFPIDVDGKIKALVTCGDVPTIEIDPEIINNPDNPEEPTDDNPYSIKHVIITKSEYDALEVKEQNVLYIIVNDSWTFGNKFPIILK